MNHVSIVLRPVTTTVNQLNIDVLDILCDPFYARDEILFFISRNSRFLAEFRQLFLMANKINKLVTLKMYYFIS